MRAHLVVVHLSDLQFGPNHRFFQTTEEVNSLLRRLTDDLDGLKENEGSVPDLVVVTGDLTETGRSAQFAQVHEFLNGLARHLHLAHERVIVVPGNHDVNRDECRAYSAKCAAEGVEPLKPYFPKWTQYETFVANWYGNPTRFLPHRPWSLHEFADLGVAVAALNSTLAESHAENDHFGLVTEAQANWFARNLEEAARRGWLRLGLVHHNLRRQPVGDDQNLRDADLLDDLPVNLWLHGHTHEMKTQYLSQFVPVLSTGSAGVRVPQRPSEIPNQYQVLRLRPDGLDRWCRMWIPEQRRWEADPRLKIAEKNLRIDFVGVQAVPPIVAVCAPSPGPTASGLAERVAAALSVRHQGAEVDVVVVDAGLVLVDARRRSYRLPVGVCVETSDDPLGAYAARLAQYRTVDPSIRGQFVTLTHPSEQDEKRAAGHRIDLRTLGQVQSLVDFTHAVDGARRRAAADGDRDGDYVGQEVVDAEGTNHGDAVSWLLGRLALQGPRLLLVEGPLACGKSFVLRQLVRRILTAWKPGDPVPLVIPVEELKIDRDIDGLLVRHVHALGVTRFHTDALRLMREEGRLILLFDGLEKVQLRATWEGARAQFELVAQAASGFGVVVATARSERDFLEENPEPRFVRLLGARGALERAVLHPPVGASIPRIDAAADPIPERVADDFLANRPPALLDEERLSPDQVRALVALAGNHVDRWARDVLRQGDAARSRQRENALTIATVGRLQISLDLSGQDLRGRDDLGALDLRDADLRGCDLSGLDLSGLDLTGARLDGAKLVDTRFVSAILTGTTAEGAVTAATAWLGAVDAPFGPSEPPTPQVLATGEMSHVEVSTDGRWVTSVTGGRRVTWDADTVPRRALEARPAWTALRRPHDTEQLAFGAMDGTLWLAAGPGAPAASLASPLSDWPIHDIAWDGPDSWLAAGGQGLWRWRANQPTAREFPGSYRSVDIGRDGHVAVGWEDVESTLVPSDVVRHRASFVRWNRQTGDLAIARRDHEVEVIPAPGVAVPDRWEAAPSTDAEPRFAWSPLGQGLATSRVDHVEGLPARQYKTRGHAAVAWDPVGAVLYAAMETHALHREPIGIGLVPPLSHLARAQVWTQWVTNSDLRFGGLGLRLDWPSGRMATSAFSSKLARWSRRGDHADVDNDGLLRVFRRDALKHAVRLHAGVQVRQLVWAPDGDSLAAIGNETTTVDVRSGGQVVRAGTGVGAWTYAAGYVGAELFVAHWTAAGRALRINGAESSPTRMTYPPAAAAISPIAHVVAYAMRSRSDLLYLWDWRTGHVVEVSAAHTTRITSIAWAPDGQRLASTSADGTCRIWSSDGAGLHRLRGHAGTVRDVSWSPDGTRVATAGDDGTVRLWRASDGAALGWVAEGERGGAIAVAPNGRYRASGDVRGWFWHAVGLHRFDVGELDRWVPDLRVPDDEPFPWGDDRPVAVVRLGT